MVGPGELCLVRCGTGNQVALVVERTASGLRIRRWKDASKEWAQPSSLELDKLVSASVPIGDKRRSVAQRALTKEILQSVQWTGRQGA